LNAISDKPWEKANPGYAKMLLGYFGKTPCEPDPELVKWASEKLGMEPTTERVVDINEKDPDKGIEAAKKRLEEAGLPTTEENIFISAACKDGNVDKGIEFLLGKGVVSVNKTASKEAKSESLVSKDGCTVTVNGKKYAVKLNGSKATVNGKEYDISVKDGIEEAKTSTGEGTEVKAALPGNILRIEVSEGDEVAEGDVLLVVEAMKMETEVKSPVAGKVNSIQVAQGDAVQNGQTMVVIG
jgi:pyruvate carboxylase subunit B